MFGSLAVDEASRAWRSGTRRPARSRRVRVAGRGSSGRPATIRSRSSVDAGSSRSSRVARALARARAQSPLIKSRAWVAVVVVLRRAVVTLPSGASKASRSASRVLRIARVSIVRRACEPRAARAAHGRLELAAGGQHRVADLLGVEPLDGPFPEQPVLGIDPLACGKVALAALGCLAIGRRGQDQSVQRLEMPALRDKLGSPASRAARGGWASRPGGRNRWQCRPGPGRNGTARSG